jgi:hypothetical protein
MKLSIDDIEIIDNPIKKEKSSSYELEDYMKDKIKVIVRSNIDDIRRVCFIKADESYPTIKELFKNQLWDPNTKTGIYTEEQLMTFYYDEN